MKTSRAGAVSFQPFRNHHLPKAPTGIRGLDEITQGGVPRGRPTLVCGAAGCGKTMLAAEFLVRGATEFDEPGVYMAFEETAQDLAKNVRSLDQLSRRKKLVVDHVRIERSEIEEAGGYDLEGLFIRLGHAIDSIKAKRVALDTIEALFAGLSNTAVLRAELVRLFRWLKDRGVTTVITGERGEGSLTRQGLEEYISDCVILLDHRIVEQIATRTLRIVKYRGSLHGTNEYPFLINERGIDVLPITSLVLDHRVSDKRVSSGIPRLDAMLGGKGYFRGSSVLVSGSAGTGKSSVVAHFLDAACRRGERALLFSFEESSVQVIRNMRSIGINLAPWIKKGLLQIHAGRSTLYGLEMHLATMFKWIRDLAPQVVAVDPISTFTVAGTMSQARAMLIRLVDHLKTKQITTLFTCLNRGEDSTVENTDLGVSNVMDTWLLLRNLESNGERNRGLYVLKSRGMRHSNQIREFRLTDHGIEITDVYLGTEGVLTGSARLTREAREKAAIVTRRQGIEARRRTLDRKRQALEAKIAGLREEFKAEQEEALHIIGREDAREEGLVEDRATMAISRRADVKPTGQYRRSPTPRRK